MGNRWIPIILLLFTSIVNAQTTFLFDESTLNGQATGAISTWTASGSAVFGKLHPTGFKQSTTVGSTTLAVDNSTSTATTLFGQFISPVLEAQTISGTVTSFFRMSIANTSGATVQSRVKITVINMAGTVVATLLNITSGANNLTTTLTSYQVLNAAALSSYSCARGDRICVEVGIGRSVGTTARNGTVSFGSSSGTNITAAGSTTANNPAITFSGNIIFYKGVN